MPHSQGHNPIQKCLVQQQQRHHHHHRRRTRNVSRRWRSCSTIRGNCAAVSSTVRRYEFYDGGGHPTARYAPTNFQAHKDVGVLAAVTNNNGFGLRFACPVGRVLAVG